MIAHQDRNLILLGPQPAYASLKAVLHKIPYSGPVALITAGWETDEQEDYEIRQAIDCEVINLKLFARTEKLFEDDPELIQQLQHRQDELRLVRDVYNERLMHQTNATRWLFHHHAPEIDLNEERESAIAMMRLLDNQHFGHASRIIDRYEVRLQTHARHLVAEHRRELAEILGRCGLLLIAGGHVAIIINRLSIFGILELTPQIPIIAWSGGAMALAERVVVFHDSLPQSLKDAEVLRPGMGVFDRVLPLPDARNRLETTNRIRVEMFARRFLQYQSVIFDEHTMLQRNQGKWRDYTEGRASRLGEHGSIVEFQP
jgi:hypothetical protein